MGPVSQSGSRCGQGGRSGAVGAAFPRPNRPQTEGRISESDLSRNGVSAPPDGEVNLLCGVPVSREHTFADSEFGKPGHDPKDAGAFDEGLVFVIMPFRG